MPLRFKISVCALLLLAAAGCVRREETAQSVREHPAIEKQTDTAVQLEQELERWTENEDGSRVLEEWYETGEKKTLVHYSSVG